jgi:hypothetical protein
VTFRFVIDCEADEYIVGTKELNFYPSRITKREVKEVQVRLSILLLLLDRYIIAGEGVAAFLLVHHFAFYWRRWELLYYLLGL